jgi:plastocyanin
MTIPLRLRKADLVSAALALAVFLLVVVPIAIFYRSHFAPIAVGNKLLLVTVNLRGQQFHPDRITITRGTVVHIVNDDIVMHHVYVKSPSMNFDSGDQPVGASVNLEFDHPGTFHVLCTFHATMDLLVMVK